MQPFDREDISKGQRGVIYEAAFKFILKSWRKKQTAISDLMKENDRKEKTSQKCKTQLHTINALYSNERKNNRDVEIEIKSTKCKLDRANSKINELQEESDEVC